MNGNMHTAVLIAVMAVVTFLLRAFPFLLFGGRKMPESVRYLGDVLPPAVMGMLVVYCLRNIRFSVSPFGFPEIVSCILVVILQRCRRSSLLSIIAGTAAYMLLIRLLP